MSDKLNQLIELLKLEKIDDLIFRGACEDLGFRQVLAVRLWRNLFLLQCKLPRRSVYSTLAMLTF